jgi:hypothetical protein
VTNKKKNFKIEKFLNPKGHPSSGFVVAYHGKSPWKKKEEHTYLRIGDCHQIVSLHKTDYDTNEDFIKKLEQLETVIFKFKEHLKSL